MTRTKRISVVGALYLVYVAVAAAFAYEYECLYEKDPNNFSFTSQITTVQKREQENFLESSQGHIFGEAKEPRRAATRVITISCV